MNKLILIPLFISALISCKKNNPEPETPPAPVTSVGAIYQGGIVFQLDADGQHGLIITQHDIDTCKWTNESGNSSDFEETIPFEFKQQYASNDYVGAGLPFTNKIVEVRGNTGVYAAKVCKDLVLNGYDDWYLPTWGEMRLVVQSEVFNSNNADEKFYWTSSEGDTNFSGKSPFAQSATIYSWIAPWTSNPPKNTLLPVRAIRKF